MKNLMFYCCQCQYYSSPRSDILLSFFNYQLNAQFLYSITIYMLICIVGTCILIKLKFLSPKNAPLYYTYKMLKYTARSFPDCSYMFRSTWTINRKPIPNLVKVTILNHKLHGTQYTPQLETLFNTTLLNT